MCIYDTENIITSESAAHVTCDEPFRWRNDTTVAVN